MKAFSRVGVFLSALIVFSTLVRAEPTPVQCEEIGRRAAATMAHMDSTFKLKTGLLLGEISMSKSVLLGCVDQNKLAETRASLLWFSTDLGLILISGLAFFHQRQMRKAMFALNHLVAKEKPEHSPRYLPSQWFNRFLMISLVLGFLTTNLVGLFL